MKQAARPAIFKGRQTEPELILCAVRWHLRYSLSFRDVEELLSELRLSWKQLYRQFGAEPNRASKVAQQAFRRDSLRELKKIKRAWPDLNYSTVTGGLVISPSPPRIPPAQIHLISE